MTHDSNTPADIPLHAVKFDGGKPRMELLPDAPLIAIAQVLTYGAAKYDDHNWRKGFRWTRLIGAMRRHVSAWMMGEECDPESGLPHLAHAACCLLMLMDHQHYGVGVDDRWQRDESEAA